MNATATKTTEVQSLPTIQAYITSEDYTQEDVASMPGTYDWEYEEGPFFEDVVIEVTEKAFQEACVRMKPLLNKFPVNHLVVGIDIYGMHGYPSILHFGTNGAENGSATASFLMQPELLEELLKAYFDKNHQINFPLLQQFDMALVHSMDYSSGKYLPLPDASINPLTHFVSFLNSIRQVGMKKMGIYLQQSKPQNEISNAETSANDFFDTMVENLSEGNDLLAETKLFIEKVSPSIYKNAPLIMLQLIFANGQIQGNIKISELAKKALNVESDGLNDEEKHLLITYVLEMSNEKFLLSLGKPGYIESSLFPQDVFDKVFKMLYSDHHKHAQNYADSIAADAREKVENLTTSFHDSNKGLSDEKRLCDNYLNRELKSILHDEAGLLELAEKLFANKAK